jgi:hypothetical protein
MGAARDALVIHDGSTALSLCRSFDETRRHGVARHNSRRR